jgi:hypothetical protein
MIPRAAVVLSLLLRATRSRLEGNQNGKARQPEWRLATRTEASNYVAQVEWVGIFILTAAERVCSRQMIRNSHSSTWSYFHQAIALLITLVTRTSKVLLYLCYPVSAGPACSVLLQPNGRTSKLLQVPCQLQRRRSRLQTLMR